MIDFALSFLRGQYLATPLQVLSEMSLLESNDDVKQVLKQAGEALTLPIRVPAKVVLDTLRELEEKAPGNISVLPKKTQTSFTFDFTSIGIGALLPIKALTKRKPKRGHAKGDEGASEEMVKDSLDSSRSGKGLQHHESRYRYILRHIEMTRKCSKRLLSFSIACTLAQSNGLLSATFLQYSLSRTRLESLTGRRKRKAQRMPKQPKKRSRSQ